MAATPPVRGRTSPIYYSQNDVRFGKYFKSVTKIGQEVLFHSFVFFYRSVNENTGTETLSIWDYCLHTLGWSKTKIKETFMGRERDAIRLSPSDPNFHGDVSFYYKLIVRTMDHDVPETLRKKVQDLKNLRNSVCHERIDMDEDEFNDRMEALASLCSSILQEVAQCTGTDTTDIEKEITQYLKDLRGTELKSEDIQSYMKEVQSFRTQKYFSFITQGRQELMRLYSSLNILNPFTLLGDEAFLSFTIENIFTKLVLESGDIEVTMNDILNPGALKQRYNPRLVVLSGLMGSGKTSVCKFLLHEWCKANSSLKEIHTFDIIIFIDANKVSSLSFTSFLREQLMKTTTRNFSESDVVPLLQEMNVLFVVDGFDEATNEGKSVLKEVFRKFTESRIIVTTRPEFTMEVKTMVEEHVIITVYGFNKSLRDEYAKRVFTILEKDEESRRTQMARFMNYVNEMQSILKNHLRLPLIWTLLLVLWRQDPEKLLEVRSATKLYQELYSLCTLKLVGCLEDGGQVHRIVLEQRLKQWQIKLGELAFDLLQRDTLELGPRHMTQIVESCGPLHLEPIRTLSSFLKCDVKEKLTGSDYCFSFFHRSSAEYMAAMFIANRVLEGAPLASFFSNEGDVHKFFDLIIFVAGHLRLHGELLVSHAEELVQMIRTCCGSMMNHSLLCRLVQETDRDPSVCHLLGNEAGANEIWVVSSTHHWVSDEQLTLLKYTSYAPKTLIVAIRYDAAPSMMEALPTLLKLVSFHHHRTSIRLYLENQYQILDSDQGVPNQELSSNIARLIELNMLVELKFHVDCTTAASLNKAKKLEVLYARISTLPALMAFVTTVSQRRSPIPLRLKSLPRFSFKKEKLKSMELLLDLKSDDVSPKSVPRLNWGGDLTVILVGVSDSRVSWAAGLLSNLVPIFGRNRLILQRSSLTSGGAADLMHSLSQVTFREVQIMSCHDVTWRELKHLSKLWTRIRWGCDVKQDLGRDRRGVSVP